MTRVEYQEKLSRYYDFIIVYSKFLENTYITEKKNKGEKNELY